MTMVDVLRPCAANAMISAGKVHLKKLLDKSRFYSFVIQVDACVFNSTPWWKEMETKHTELHKPPSER